MTLLLKFECSKNELNESSHGTVSEQCCHVDPQWLCCYVVRKRLLRVNQDGVAKVDVSTHTVIDDTINMLFKLMLSPN